jgi:hypothetical protein
MHLLRTLVVLGVVFQPVLLQADSRSDPVVVATDRFQLRSDSRVNLHHFLLAWAAADADAWPPYAMAIAEREYWRALLDEADERAWFAATDAYAAGNGRDVVFDPGLIALRDWAAGVASREKIPAADRVLADALEKALPVYERHWWPAHDISNRAWTAALAPVLRVIENDIPPRLEAAYGGNWPDVPVPVDVMVYCNPVGAYSTGGRVSISGADFGNGMPQALELLFHEASHLDSLELPLRNQLAKAFRSAGGDEPERLWHDMIFFTTGATMRLVLAEHGHPGYRHYGEFGVYRRGERWAVQLPLLEQHWLPFLESRSTDADVRRMAIEALAGGL